MHFCLPLIHVYVTGAIDDPSRLSGTLQYLDLSSMTRFPWCPIRSRASVIFSQDGSSFFSQ